MSEVTTLGQLVAEGRLILNDGYRTKKSELGEPGVPILRVADVAMGSISPSYVDFVSEEYRAKFAAKTSRAGDVVVTTKGTVGRVAQIGDADPELVYSPQICFFRAIPGGGVVADFLRYWFQGPEFYVQSQGVQAQTDMAAYINLADMRDIHVSLPDEESQTLIAGVLRILDDKISSNSRVVQGLVRLTCLLMRGQSRIRVRDVGFLDKGLSYKGSGLVGSGGDRLINLAQFNSSGRLDRSSFKYYVGESKEHHRVHGGNLVIANTDLTQQRVILGRGALVPSDVGTCLFTHHVYAVRFTPDEGLTLPLWAALNSAEFRHRAEGFATGTTVAALPADAVLDFEFPVPDNPSTVREAWELIGRASAAERESVSLGALRDALLPELLSGRLRVPEAEELVSDVV